MASLLIIMSIGMTLFCNIYLSDLTIKRFLERPSEYMYKRVTFIYIFVMGSLILFWHSLHFPYFYCSAAVLLVHLVYMAILIKIRPYQMSLHVHSVGLFINQIILLIVLVFVNLLNYVGDLNEILVLALGFLIVGVCAFTVVIGVIRLYFEYRYGRVL
jgi:hypothetical protein